MRLTYTPSTVETREPTGVIVEWRLGLGDDGVTAYLTQTHNSVVECYAYIVEVVGSNPSESTDSM